MTAKILLAHPGTQHARHLARQLHKRHLLAAFYTGLGIGEQGWQSLLVNSLPATVKNKISNRMVIGVPQKLIKQFFFNEVRALKALKNGAKAESVLLSRNKEFQNNIPDKAITNADAVIGFDTSSWILAERCKQLNRPFILDISIAHPYEKRAVYQQISDQYPEWSFLLEQKSQQMIDLEMKEMELADKIVVASTFSKNSLIKNWVPERKIYVNPYGTDLTSFKPLEKNNRSVQFVFVGLVDARKGIPVLLEAWKKIKLAGAALTLIGPVSEHTATLIKKEAPDITIKGRIPYDTLPGELAQYDVLVFPSYFEGFALVIPEAMASGLTTITTPATCAPDIVDDDLNGFIIPCGDAKQLANKMQALINDPAKLKDMQKESLKKIQNFTWDAYGERWAQIIREIEI